MKTIKQFTPDASLRSILRTMPGDASDRVSLLCLASGVDRTQLAAAVGTNYVRLSSVVRDPSPNSKTREVRSAIAAFWGLTAPDLWPEPATEDLAAA